MKKRLNRPEVIVELVKLVKNGLIGRVWGSNGGRTFLRLPFLMITATMARDFRFTIAECWFSNLS